MDDPNSDASFLRVQVWGMFLQSLAFGVYLTTSSLGIHLYLNLQMVATAVTHMQAVSQFSDGSRPINIAKYTTILVQTVICSGVLIYRCWLVHNRTWPSVAISLVLWLGAVALMGIVIHIDTVHKISGIFDISQSKVFGSCFWGVLIVANLVTTSLIAYRVWRIAKLRCRSNFATDTASTSPAIKTSSHIIIESGLIYTIMTLVTFLLFVAQSNT
ncbi:hypothetical protein B0H16DRAFT_1492921, partial [Mycena metata]